MPCCFCSVLLVSTINAGIFSTRGSASFKQYMADVYPFRLWKNILDVVVIPGLNVASVHIKTDTYPGLFAFKLPRGQPPMFFQLAQFLTSISS